MDRFDDVSVVASVDETPEPPRRPRRRRRASIAVVASIVAAGALAGATVGLADEKSEPAPAATHMNADGLPAFSGTGHPCHHGDGMKRPGRTSQMRY